MSQSQATVNSEPLPSPFKRALILVLLPLLYYLGAKFAIGYTVMPDGMAILWPPNSVLLAAMLLLGRRDLVWLSLLAIAAEIAGDMPFFRWHEALAFGASNVLEAGVAWTLLRYWRFDIRFAALSDVLKFVVGALLIAACSAAVIGAALFYYFRHPGIPFLEHVRILWFGDALAMMIFTPLLINLWPVAGAEKTAIQVHSYDYVLGLLALVLSGCFVISHNGQVLGVHIGPTLLLPFAIYAGARFGTRCASIAVAGVALTIIVMMANGQNPFGKVDFGEAAIQAQEFIFIMGLVSLGSAALLTQLHLKQSELETANLSLNEWNRNLEFRVAERTVELSQANTQLENEMRERKAVEEALQAANQELQRLAGIDGLTQIANRRGFDARLQREWKRLARDGAPLSLILFDLDFFKCYNDCYGHQAGDACLIQVAAAAAEAVKRPADLLARYGGEEFAVILPETDATGALVVAEQIRVAIRQKAIQHERSQSSDIVTISAGVATCIPSGIKQPESLIHQADQALYRAKARGRNCCVA